MKKHITWLCITIAAAFVGRQFSTKEVKIVEKPVEVVRTNTVTVEKPVEVIKEVPRDVERIVEKKVEIPAEIPPHYLLAERFMNSWADAGWFDKDEMLRGIPAFRVSVKLADPSKSRVSESELRDLIELSLRKNGLPVKSDALYFLDFEVSGLWDERGITYSYSATLALREAVTILRKDGFKRASLVIWNAGYNGYAGNLKIGDGITNAAEKLVVSFSNAYLSMNSK